MVNASVESIGPEQARELLALNTANFRKPDPVRVGVYAKEMLNGNWQLNGDTIKLNGSVLIDGQHRLLAIVKSGVTIQTIVVRGLESDGKTVDRGKTRTIGQWCAHKGFKCAKDIATAGRLVVIHEKGLWSKQHVQWSDTLDSEVFNFIESNVSQLQQCVKLSRAVKPLLTPSLMAAVLYVGCGKRSPEDVDEAVWFVKALGKGEHLTTDDAVFHLRNRLISQSLQSRLTPFMKRALLTIAWNKTVNGESCTSNGLRVRLTGPAKQKAPDRVLEAPST